MSLHLPLLEKTHTQFDHPGIYKMINLITPQYYWPHINKDIENYVKHCHIYQINKNVNKRDLACYIRYHQLINSLNACH